MLQSTNPETIAKTVTTPAIVPHRAKTLRVWPAILMLVVFWAFLYANYTVEMDMFVRFISRMIAYGVLLLAFLGWWLTRRQVSHRDRFLAVGEVVLCSVVAGLLADPSVNLFVLFMTAFPFVFTTWTLWIVVSRNRSLLFQRAGFSAVVALTAGFFALLRWDGLQGDQLPQFSWRWTKTAEQVFLDTHASDGGLGTFVRQPALVRGWTLQQGDWPEFRGPNRDGVVRGVQIDTDWTTHPPEVVWRHRVGPAWSSMIVVDGFVVTQEQRGELEAVVGYQAATGEEVWTHSAADRFSEGLSGAGPRGTPTFAEGRIYVMGGNGRLVCLSAADGKLLWSRDILGETGAERPQWGYSGSPLVVDGKVIVFAGGKGQQSLVAYDAATGKPAWSQAGGTMSYSSPHLVSIHGERQILIHDNLALTSVNPADGAVLWQRPSDNEMALVTLQPHFLGEHKVLLGADPGIVLVGIEHRNERWTTADQWPSKALKPSFNDFVVYGDHIYGLDDGILACIDLETGRRLWKKGRYGHGQVLLVADQGLLFVLSEKGEVVLVAANPDGLDELGRIQAIEGKTWNHPVLAHGHLYVRNGEEMACYRLKLADTP